jgi:hypothetical protein
MSEKVQMQCECPHADSGCHGKASCPEKIWGSKDCVGQQLCRGCYIQYTCGEGGTDWYDDA